MHSMKDLNDSTLHSNVKNANLEVIPGYAYLYAILCNDSIPGLLAGQSS